MSARVFSAEEVDWVTPPGHADSLSKLLVNPENSTTATLDFRLSITRPGGIIEEHAHAHAENLYYVVRGNGVIMLNGTRHPIRANTVIFIPPGVRHGLTNSGLEDLVMVVLAAPWQDMPH